MRAFAAENMRWLVGPRSLRRFWPAFGVFDAACDQRAGRMRSSRRSTRSSTWTTRCGELLHTVTAPTLVLVGSQDILTPQADSEEIAELIPDAELVIVQGGAHGFMVENFGPFNKLVLEFLERVTAEQSAA